MGFHPRGDELVIVRRFSLSMLMASGMACSRSGDLGGFWTMISGSIDSADRVRQRVLELLRVLSFPLFLVGMFRRSVSARPLGDGVAFSLLQFLAKPQEARIAPLRGCAGGWLGVF